MSLAMAGNIAGNAADGTVHIGAERSHALWCSELRVCLAEAELAERVQHSVVFGACSTKRGAILKSLCYSSGNSNLLSYSMSQIVYR